MDNPRPIPHSFVVFRPLEGRPMNAVRDVPGLPRYRFVERLAVLPFVESVILYGSRARGDQRQRSDIDLAVSAPSADARQWQQVLEVIDDADTLHGIDCVRVDALPGDDPLRRNIEAEGVTLYRRTAKP